jgi:hypothetical protein
VPVVCPAAEIHVQRGCEPFLPVIRTPWLCGLQRWSSSLVTVMCMEYTVL